MLLHLRRGRVALGWGRSCAPCFLHGFLNCGPRVSGPVPKQVQNRAQRGGNVRDRGSNSGTQHNKTRQKNLLVLFTRMFSSSYYTSFHRRFLLFLCMVLTPAPIVPSTACSNNLFILRDYEHASALSPLVCGNKARKLASLIEALPTKSKSPLVSHGGGQSNAMLALARVCHASSTPFTYHTRPLPRWLRSKPIGNLAKALALGMCLVEHKTAVAYEAACADLRSQPNFVPQGAAYPGAELGVAGLATEIDDWWGATRRRQGESLAVVVPAGTGTTALYLARHLSAVPSVQVYAVPCVGGKSALLSQMNALDAASGGHAALPQVLSPPARLSVPFGAPHASLLEEWRRAASEHGVLLDLLYGSIAFGTLADVGYAPPRGTLPRGSAGSASASTTSLYVNAGGHEGLGISLRRYARGGLLREGETAESALAWALQASGTLRLDDDPFA
jgi:1-aminocyclopropane-1-carboxylate deaminase